MDHIVPGAASLLESVDKKVLLVLRDGRTLVGQFGTYDQFGNIFLMDTVERIFVPHEEVTSNSFIQTTKVPTTDEMTEELSEESKTIDASILKKVSEKWVYGQVKHGMIVIRGENIVMMGDINEKVETSILESTTAINSQDALRVHASLQSQRKEYESKKSQALKERGFCTEIVEGDAY